MAVTLFEYRYRDAGNFKAAGAVVLDGSVSRAEERKAVCRFMDREYFVAEQIGVPVLYDELYRWSGGPAAVDVCWHEFVGFTAAPEGPLDPPHLGKARAFLDRIAAVGEWNLALSPHASL